MNTYRVTRAGEVATLSPDPPSTVDSESLWQALLAKQDMLVQPFLPHVIESGEKSLIWIDGEVTHGVLKRAKSGDFRVQDDHGGTVAPLSLTQTDKELAQDIMTKCLQHCASQGWEAPLYARVDLMRNKEGQWLVSERWWNRNCGSDFIQSSSDLGTGHQGATRHLGLTDCGSGLRGAQRRFPRSRCRCQTKQQPGPKLLFQCP